MRERERDMEEEKINDLVAIANTNDNMEELEEYGSFNKIKNSVPAENQEKEIVDEIRCLKELQDTYISLQEKKVHDDSKKCIYNLYKYYLMILSLEHKIPEILEKEAEKKRELNLRRGNTGFGNVPQTKK